MTAVKTFRVAVAYEEGIVFDLKAKTKKEAEEKALHIVGEYGRAVRQEEAKNETVHRDYFIA